ncbi:MAG: hypothetical protein ABIR66_10935, partial [Saprospiraceae bacterium]
KQLWFVLRPHAMTIKLPERQIQLNGHSMAFFLLILMQVKESTQANQITTTKRDKDEIRFKQGMFSMDDFEALAAMIPDEILPPYRKNRSYINSVLAGNELSKSEDPRCKMLFLRVQRGCYVIHPELKLVSG